MAETNKNSNSPDSHSIQAVLEEIQTGLTRLTDGQAMLRLELTDGQAKLREELQGDIRGLRKEVQRLREAQVDVERREHSRLLAAAYGGAGVLLPREPFTVFSGTHFKRREKNRKNASIFGS